MPRQETFIATGIGLVVKGTPTYKQWEAYGRKLGRLVKWSMFLLGDWINFGERTYGEKHAQGIAATGLSYVTCSHAAWVAGEFEFCRRRQSLEWWPHKEVALLEEPEQDKILDDVETFVRDHPVHDHPKRSEVRDWVRLMKREKVLESFADMKGRYRVVYADPPWQYNDSGASTTGSFGKAEDHCPTMPTDAIAALPIAAHTRPNSVLFMWITAPMPAWAPGEIEHVPARGLDQLWGEDLRRDVCAGARRNRLVLQHVNGFCVDRTGVPKFAPARTFRMVAPPGSGRPRGGRAG